MLRLIRSGPQAHEGDPPEVGGPGHQRTPARPLSASTSQHDLAAAKAGN